MLAVDADFGGNASRIPTVKTEVLYEYDSKYRAVCLGVSSHQERASLQHQPINQISLGCC